MSILLLTTHMNLGGIGVYVFSLAKGLVKRGHRVFVVSSGGDLVAPLEACGATHLQLNINTKSEINPRLVPAYYRLRRIIAENKIEIIHAHTRVTQVLAHALCRQTKTPYVTTCHGFFKPRMFRKIFPCWGMHCIAISEATREHLVSDFAMAKENIALVHNGVEAEKFSPDKFSREEKEKFKKNYGLDSSGPVIGTVARLSSVKGQRYLLSAMGEILKNYPRAQLLLVGDGPEKDKLAGQVKELGIEKSVFFIPSTFDTSVPLSVMDVFVFPSLIEGLGLAIIEAQAMGLAVVASDVGGIYTLVKDGVNGLLVQSRDSHALAEAVQKVIKDKKTAEDLGRRAREQALGCFNLNQMVDGIEDVYRRVLKKE